MKIMSVIPAAAASSTAYWISGLSTTGNISLGLALVAGRKRVPRPATGNTALVTLSMMSIPTSVDGGATARGRQLCVLKRLAENYFVTRKNSISNRHMQILALAPVL